MAKALSHIRDRAAHPAEMARMIIVTSCAAALMAAGQMLPF